MTLRQQLDAVMAGRDDWYRALLRDIAARLQATACTVVLREGDAMPDFVLPNAEGELVFSDDLLARGPLVLCFFRGGWCPFCNTTLAALQEALPDIAAAGATLVALSPETAGYVTETKHRLGLGYELLSDVDSATALRFGAAYCVPDAYRAALLAYGIDLLERQGDPSCLLPLPATFVAGQDGILRYAHASGDVADRTEPAAVLDLLRQLNT